MKEEYNEIEFSVNPAQMRFVTLPAKNKYVIYSRGTGKSFINGFEMDENVRLMPRGITTLTQATYGQALTKTLPSSFKALETLGYKRYDEKTKTGDYVICRTPPAGWYRPYEHILSYEHCITFSNGHAFYLLTQDGNSRGPNADFNITDEALTLNKKQFDEEVAPTNRGNERIWGSMSRKPLAKHHGNLFTSSAPYLSQQKWLLEPAHYYEIEKGISLIDVWNKMVRMQMKLIDAKLQNDPELFKEIWNECVRIRHTIHPFVSRDGTLFMLASIFDNIVNVGFSYIMNQYKVMDRMSFMVEILNYIVDKVDSCYYHFSDSVKYYNEYNSSYIRDFAENSDFNFDALSQMDSRYDADCRPNQALELCFDWGSSASFLEVAQCSDYDYVTHTTMIGRTVDNTINEFFVKREEIDDTEVNALVDEFLNYYRHHPCKTIDFFRDRYGDVRHANAKKSYNELAIERLKKAGWEVRIHVHGGIEPPQHDKYLLWSYIAAEKDPKFPLKRFNATKCKHIVLSMNNTRVKESGGRFSKDKSSERNKSIAPEDATHFGDVVDKRIWTKYNHLLKVGGDFVPVRI